MKNTLKEVLNNFFRNFSSTIDLAEELIAARRNPQEILLLLCGRLDALASGSVREGTPSGQSFAHFVTAYGQERRLFKSVSVGDLYYEVAYHQWLLPGTIEKAGRLHRFSRVDDDILSLLIESDIPLTELAAGRFLTKILRTLRHYFRVVPGQPRKKRMSASKSKTLEVIVSALEKGKAGTDSTDAFKRALGHFIDSKIIARILYERFRCEVIHGGTVLIDEGKFFAEKEPYWKPWFSDSYGSFLQVEFPARWLMNLLRKCIEGYRSHLTAKGKLPPGIMFQAFEGDILEYSHLVDADLLPEGGSVKFDI